MDCCSYCNSKRLAGFYSFRKKPPPIICNFIYIFFYRNNTHYTLQRSYERNLSGQLQGQIMGYVRSLMICATLAGAFMGGKLLDEGGLFSYRWIFPLGGITGVISALIFSRIRVPLKTKVKEIKTYRFQSITESLKNIATSKILLYVFAIEFIIGLLRSDSHRSLSFIYGGYIKTFKLSDRVSGKSLFRQGA